MLEILFSDSAAGSMKVGMNYRRKPGKAHGAVGFIFGKGHTPDAAELERLQRDFEAREERKWAQALPLTGDRADILSFSLAFSYGQIDDEPVGKGREDALDRLFSIYPEEIGQSAKNDLLQSARKHIDRLLLRAGEGEAIRVWVDAEPDTACGLLWLCHLLVNHGLDRKGITIVRRPLFAEGHDGALIRACGWGETDPADWGRLAQKGAFLPSAAVQAMAAEWDALRREGGCLRGLLNGRVVTLPENVYDGFILRELAEMPGQFPEAQLIGKVLGKYRLGIGDGFLALRIEEMIRDGLLAAVTEADGDSPKYHRMIRKI